MCTGGSLTQYRMGLLGHVFDLHTGHDSHFGANSAILQCPHRTGPLRHDERSGAIGLMGASGLDDEVAVYRQAGDHVIGLIAGITDAQWTSPALGPWTVRTLVGHIGRAFTTVTEYLARPANTRDVHSAADYYLVALTMTDPVSIQARAEKAARDLGEDPLAAIRAFRDAALDALASEGDPLITTVAGGMLLSDYLPTRIVELAVHSVDLARATGQATELPAAVCDSALQVAVAAAGRRGQGQSVLLALTGRKPLPDGFSVV